MANKAVRTKGTGAAGRRSSRWLTRAETKASATKGRRAEDAELEAAETHEGEE